MKILQVAFLICALPFLIFFLESGKQRVSLKHEHSWSYRIDHEHLSHFGSETLVTLAHQSSGELQPLTLELRCKDRPAEHFQIQSYTANEIRYVVPALKDQIDHAIIRSNHQLEFSSKVRLLQSGVNLTDTFLEVTMPFVLGVVKFSRNMVLLGIVTNTVDTFLPLVIYMESFLMLSFWATQLHLMTPFFNEIHNSRLDLCNLIRLMITPSTPDPLAPSLLSQYGFSSNLLANLSGELIITLILIAFTIIIKLSPFLVQHERLRLISSKIKGVWNGYFLAILPRITTFIGWHSRIISLDPINNIMNIIVLSILGIAVLTVFIMLIVEIRGIVASRVQKDAKRTSLGLDRRLNINRRFHFDCLQYSTLYYPVMNYLRIILYFLPIGLAQDISYCSCGGPLLAELLYIMVQTTSTGYVLTRDKILYPLSDLLLMIVQTCIIMVSLTESVLHSQISVEIENALFALFAAQIVIFFGVLVLDTVQDYELFKKKDTGTDIIDIIKQTDQMHSVAGIKSKQNTENNEDNDSDLEDDFKDSINSKKVSLKSNQKTRII